MQRIADFCGKAIRETAHAIDRMALIARENDIFRESFSRHRSIMPVRFQSPNIGADCFVAPNASVIGNVNMENGASVANCCILFGYCL